MLRKQVERARTTPDLLPRIRKSLAKYGAVISLLQACLLYLRDSLATIKATPLPRALQDPYDLTGKELLKCLPIEVWREKLDRRMDALDELLGVCSADIAQASALTDSIDTLRLHQQLHRIGSNTHVCAEGSASEYKDSVSIRLMVVLIGSVFAWRFFDRTFCLDLKQLEYGPHYGYPHPYTDDAPAADEAADGASAWWQPDLTGTLSASPGVMFVLSLLWAVIICLVLRRIITNLLKGRDTMVRLHPVPLDIEIDDLRYFALYLSSKKLISSRILEMRGRDVKQVEWQEWDRLGEETAGRWGEMQKRWAAPDRRIPTPCPT